MSIRENHSGVKWGTLALTAGSFLVLPGAVAAVGVATELHTNIDTTGHNVVIDDLGEAYAHLRPLPPDAPVIIDGQQYTPAPQNTAQPDPASAISALESANSQITDLDIPTPAGCAHEDIIDEITDEVDGFPPTRRSFDAAASCVLQLVEAAENAKEDYIHDKEPPVTPKEYYIAAAAILATEITVVGAGVVGL